MTESSRLATEGIETEEPEASWPLKYRMIDPWIGQPRKFWCYDMYRGPENVKVQVLYSKTLEESEIIARQFFDEPVIGFDMEWVSNSTHGHSLGACVSLIQIACEDKIGLFHIALHPGRTVDQLIAPSLRKIIEDQTIKKAGVAVLNADFSRLKKFFHLKPRGALELSHLHNLITFGGRQNHRVTTRLVKLATQVETHLALPLFKGSVRTSKWNRPLTPAQINYAASDAYCGYMLYYCMNSKRKLMKPCPPIPILADAYLKGPSIKPMLLEGNDKEGQHIRVADFYAPKKDNTEDIKNKDEDGQAVVVTEKPMVSKQEQTREKPAKKKKVADQEPLDPASQALLDELAVHRSKAALDLGVPVYLVANNATLLGLARARPCNEKDMLGVNGVGKKKLEMWGPDWLKIINTFVADHDLATAEIQVTEEQSPEGEDTGYETQATHLDSQIETTPAMTGPITRKRKGTTHLPHDDTPSSPAAFGSPVQRLPVLHTGLSFGLEDMNVDSQDNVSQSSSNDSMVFCTPLSHIGSASKRRRSASLVRASSPTPTIRKAVDANTVLSLERRKFRSQLMALSRAVKLNMTSNATDAIIDGIIFRSPRTERELLEVPGARIFTEACAAANKDLLKNVIKWTPSDV